MMPIRNSVVLPAPAAWSLPAAARSAVRSRPAPGCRTLPTTSPIVRATVDIVRKYASARPPTLPTWAALATDPTPSTIVQKITGEIIIRMRATKASPMGLSFTAKSGATNPTRTPRATAAITAM